MEKEAKYISLQETSKYCDYSQDYLSLRARQGKLKAMKFGRNWVTTREWLEEYLSGVSEGVSEPPENLPTGQFSEFEIPDLELLKKQTLAPQVRFGFILVLTLALAFTGIFLGKDSFQNVYQNTSSDLVIAAISYQGIQESTTFALGEYRQWLSQQPLVIARKFQFFSQRIVQGYDAADGFIDRKIEIGLQQMESFFQGIVQKYSAIDKLVEEKIKELVQDFQMRIHPKEKIFQLVFASAEAETNIIIHTSGIKVEELRKEIKAAFSDEVAIEFNESEKSGTVKPILPGKENQKYFFKVIPLK